MKKLMLIWCLFAAARCFAVDGVTVFQAGLQAFRENGADALLGVWYSQDDAEKLRALRARLVSTAQALGPVMDTEVFAPQNLGTHVQRLYGVIYFEKRPLWIRADYYAIGGRSGFIALEFSLSADEILPASRTTVIP